MRCEIQSGSVCAMCLWAWECVCYVPESVGVCVSCDRECGRVCVMWPWVWACVCYLPVSVWGCVRAHATASPPFQYSSQKKPPRKWFGDTCPQIIYAAVFCRELYWESVSQIKFTDWLFSCFVFASRLLRYDRYANYSNWLKPPAVVQ